MSFRFRRTLKIAPGLRLNLGKTGVSLSAGVRGARVTFGSKRGTTATVGLPGSGLHYTTTLSSSRHASVDAEYLTKKELRVLTYNLAQAEIESEKENFGEFLCLVQKTPQLLPKEKWEEELLQRPFTLALYGESKAFLEEFKSKAKVKNWDALIESWKTKVLIFPLVLLIVYQMFFENPTNHYLPYAVLGFYFLQASTVAWWVYIWWIDRKQALASAVVEYETITRQHKELQEKHPSVEAQRIEHLRKLIAADEEVLVEVLEESFVTCRKKLLIWHTLLIYPLVLTSQIIILFYSI
ncbi:MAG: DUF4236 domain-containing protein [Bdellovibrionota bacterium]